VRVLVTIRKLAPISPVVVARTDTDAARAKRPDYGLMLPVSNAVRSEVHAWVADEILGTRGRRAYLRIHLFSESLAKSSDSLGVDFKHE
jgi:hypothetical protein